MVDFIDNIINPPEEIGERQVWRLMHSADDVLVIDASHEEDGVLISVLLSRITELNDGSDVILSSTGEDTSLFPSDRIALRITKGPVPVKELGYFRGTITEIEFEKIRKSIKYNSFKYNEIQKEYIAGILENIAPLREQAIRQYESILIQLPQHTENYSVNKYEYRWAADDAQQREKLREFWKKEREMRVKGITFDHLPNLEIVINVIDDVLYIMYFSDTVKHVGDIKIVQEDKVVSANDKQLNLQNKNRAFTSFDSKYLRSGKCILKFTVDDKVNNMEIELQ